jgi:pyridoxal phosphate enzyme (YggS family)
MAIQEAQTAARIRENLAEVRDRVVAAAARAGRSDPPRIVGITKYVEPPVARLLAEAGLDDLGESRPQELWRKASALADLQVCWHLVGHLQRNKVRRTLPLVACIHSADSLRLLEEISREAVSQNLTANVLLEVNVSGEAAKTGLGPHEVEPLFPAIAGLPRLQVMGLMTMASHEGSPDRTRREFAALRELRDRLAQKCPPNIGLSQLSMGMSGDYEIAIEEGATIVRIGSALFEGLSSSLTP